MNKTVKPKIAWFTPESDSSRSWYLCSAINEQLSQRFEITLYGAVTNSGKNIKSYLSAYADHRSNPFNLFVYNLEDTTASYFSRFALGLIPGVVIFHDFLLLTDGPEPIHNSAWENIRESFINDAAWPIRNTSHDRHGPWASRESAFALGGLFFSPWAHQEWFGKKRDGLVEERPSSSIWYPSSLVPRDESLERTVVYTGKPAVEDRAVSVLRAVMKSSATLRWLINEDEAVKAKELIADEKSQKFVTLVIGRTPEKWREIVKGASVCLHPRMSVYGDTGPYLEISLASGAPVVVTDFGRSSYLPDAAVIKIQPGTQEVAELEVVITQIAGEKAPYSSGGVAFANEYLTPQVVGHEVALFIERALPLSKKFLGIWKGFEEKAKQDLLAESWQGWNFSDPVARAGLEPHFKELFGV